MFRKMTENHQLCGWALRVHYHTTRQENETSPTVVWLNERLRKYATAGTDNYMQNTLLVREGKGPTNKRWTNRRLEHTKHANPEGWNLPPALWLIHEAGRARLHAKTEKHGRYGKILFKSVKHINNENDLQTNAGFNNNPQGWQFAKRRKYFLKHFIIKTILLKYLHFINQNGFFYNYCTDICAAVCASLVLWEYL